MLIEDNPLLLRGEQGSSRACVWDKKANSGYCDNLQGGIALTRANLRVEGPVVTITDLISSRFMAECSSRQIVFLSIAKL